MSDPGDWVDLGAPSPETEHWAKVETKRLDGRGERSWAWYGTPDQRMKGKVAERGVWHWLTVEGIAFTANGGMDTLPDLEVGNHGVGVRMTATNREGFKPHYGVQMARSQQARADQLLYVGHVRPRNGYVVLGAISALRVRARARLVYEGDDAPFGIGRSKMDTYVFPIRLLEAPRRWLGRFRGSPQVES